MKLDGKEYTKNYLTHKDLLDSATISFKMDAKPNQQHAGIKRPISLFFLTTNLKKIMKKQIKYISAGMLQQE